MKKKRAWDEVKAFAIELVKKKLIDAGEAMMKCIDKQDMAAKLQALGELKVVTPVEVPMAKAA